MMRKLTNVTKEETSSSLNKFIMLNGYEIIFYNARYE